MPLLPPESAITYSGGTGSGTVYVNEVTLTEAYQNFDRLEFSNAKLRDAPTSTGAKAMIVPAFGNQPIQLLTTCTGDVPRPLGPDDSNIANIKKRWNIQRFTIRGAANNFTDVGNLLNTFQTHLVLLNGFDLYLGELSMDLSITYITTTLQALTFSGITGTGFTIAGKALGGTYNNMLITAFEGDAMYEAPLNDGSGNSTVLYGFTATIENRTLNSQGPVS